jgi:hypothetical protein
MVQATTEQLRAVEEFCTGANLALQAGAGIGKTTTLQLLARSRPGLRGRYIAFNRSIATRRRASSRLVSRAVPRTRWRWRRSGTATPDGSTAPGYRAGRSAWSWA